MAKTSVGWLTVGINEKWNISRMHFWTWEDLLISFHGRNFSLPVLSFNVQCTTESKKVSRIKIETPNRNLKSNSRNLVGYPKRSKAKTLKYRGQFYFGTSNSSRNCSSRDRQYLTEPFAIFEPTNQENSEFCAASKLWEDRSGSWATYKFLALQST